MAFANLSVTLDTSNFTRQMTALEKDQLPFGTSLAINRTVVAAQKAVQASLTRNFTINAPRVSFLQRLVRFDRENYSTKTKLEAKFGVNDREGSSTQKDRAFILGRHELGGQRTASPDRPFAIPTGAIRGGEYDVAPRNMYPSALGLTERRTASGTQKLNVRTTRTGGVQILGKRRTFIIDARQTSDPRAWGIYQRTGSGKRDIEMIWAFRTTITLKPRLHFYEIAQPVLDTQWATIFAQAMDEAVRTAR